MTLSQSALSELLDAIRAGDGLDLVREASRLVAKELIELEASEAISARRHERTETRTTHRNGSRTRLLSTKAGDVEPHIPKLREGSFFPSLLPPRRRIDRALWAVIMEAWVHRVSTRKVDHLVTALGIESGVSKSEVNRICGELDATVGAFRERPFDHARFPYLGELRRADERLGGLRLACLDGSSHRVPVRSWIALGCAVSSSGTRVAVVRSRGS